MRALFVLAAILIALSPAAALAHGAAGHGAAPEQLQGDDARLSAAIERHAWSPVCPPGSGHVCACGNLSLCDASAQPALAVPCGVCFLPPGILEASMLPDALAPPSPQFPPNLPRAPPQLS
jgi:hypothetical protein